MFDAHCDTLLKISRSGEMELNNFDVSFEKLSFYKKATQLFAIFNDGGLKVNDIIRLISLLKSECKKSKYAAFCVNYDDIKNNKQKVSALVSIEGVGNTPDFLCTGLKEFYDNGVRILSLTWNNDNILCGGIGENKKGLTESGVDALKEMRRLGMILDVSHISDIGFWQSIEIEGLNIMATHSNSRTICPNLRNLTDEQFIAIKNRGGVAGINTYPLFVNGNENADVHDLIRHIEHFCSLGGEKNICLGADFDGIEHHMSDINSCEKMYVLADELAKMKYDDLQIRGILCENLMNFYKKMNF